MTLGAVAQVAGEDNFIKVEYATGPIDGEVASQFFAGMNAMNHETEVNRLRWHIERTAKSSWNLARHVHGCRIMAEFAVLCGVLPPATVESDFLMADVTVLGSHDFPPGNGYFIRNGNVGHRVIGPHVDGHRLVIIAGNGLQPADFHA